MPVGRIVRSINFRFGCFLGLVAAGGINFFSWIVTDPDLGKEGQFTFDAHRTAGFPFVFFDSGRQWLKQFDLLLFFGDIAFAIVLAISVGVLFYFIGIYLYSADENN